MPQRADRARVEQLLRGAVESDMMMLKLRLRERRESPPTFLKLLNEIREEEETEAARRKLTTNVRETHERPYKRHCSKPGWFKG